MTTVKSLHTYPVKSCKGIDLDASELTSSGLKWDRNWMVVDEHGNFLTQRSHPKMALISTSMTLAALKLGAPGMPLVNISLVHGAPAIRRVKVWDHACEAFDEGDHIAGWLADFLEIHCRLVRFDPGHRRVSDRHWTGTDEGLNRFSDGFPILVIAEASLADLNTRLASPLAMNRFRPNIVIDGVSAYDEDYLDRMSAGSIILRIVKPCTRCEITTTDQVTGARGPEPLRTLSTYRSSERANGGITFGQNAIVIGGAGEMVTVGMAFETHWTF